MSLFLHTQCCTSCGGTVATYLSVFPDSDLEDGGVSSLTQDPFLHTVVSTDQDLLTLGHKQLGERGREGERKRGREGEGTRGREEEREIRCR